MMGGFTRGGEYEAVSSVDDEEATVKIKKIRIISSSSWLPFYAIFSTTLTTILVITYLGLGIQRQVTGRQIPKTCSSPSVRLEWRSMRPLEQQAYIDAALCLQKTPSILTGKGTLYDDFVYVHHKAGSLSHQSAAFLPWHRAFVYIYESTLQQQCGYRGPLPYWNWELDWISIDKSDIFNSKTGFGGDGNPSFELGPGDGWCVTDGPWANSQRVWFEGKEKPHCMGRRFMYARTNGTGSIDGEWYSPEKMGMVHRAPDYQEFRAMIEGTVHNGLHWSIRGDFSSLTAANDPLFWLHHAQLDRLWWQWQEQDPEIRLLEYWGLPEETDWPSQDSWALDDMLEFAGLWKEIQVRTVMDTRSGLLCYRY